jgi:hypothetical protein
MGKIPSKPDIILKESVTEALNNLLSVIRPEGFSDLVFDHPYIADYDRAAAGAFRSLCTRAERLKVRSANPPLGVFASMKRRKLGLLVDETAKVGGFAAMK